MMYLQYPTSNTATTAAARDTTGSRTSKQRRQRRRTSPTTIVVVILIVVATIVLVKPAKTSAQILDEHKRVRGRSGSRSSGMLDGMDNEPLFLRQDVSSVSSSDEGKGKKAGGKGKSIEADSTCPIGTCSSLQLQINTLATAVKDLMGRVAALEAASMVN
jgi:hypothetical protein